LEDEYKFVSRENAEALLAVTQDVSEIRALAPAIPPLYPRSPLKIMYVGLGLAAGLLLALGLILAADYAEPRIRSSEDIARLVGVPVIEVGHGDARRLSPVWSWPTAGHRRVKCGASSLPRWTKGSVAMAREVADRRTHLRVPVASKHIVLHVFGDDGNEQVIPARLLDVSPEAMSGSAPLAGVSLGTRVGVELEMPWWRFPHRVTVPGVIRRISDDGVRWAVQFSPEDQATRRRLESFVNRTYKAFDRVLKEGTGGEL